METKFEVVAILQNGAMTATSCPRSNNSMEGEGGRKKALLKTLKQVARAIVENAARALTLRPACIEGEAPKAVARMLKRFRKIGTYSRPTTTAAHAALVAAPERRHPGADLELPDRVERVRIYGFTRGPSYQLNMHDLPPVVGGGLEPRLFGPIIIVRADDRRMDLLPAQYAAFRAAFDDGESIGSTDSERSTDGSDSGSSLKKFVVSDDVVERTRSVSSSSAANLLEWCSQECYTSSE